jgi:ectoine hydroxylase-related dioxygenase (phytanoyl-CoA dioxygenase family)
VIHRASPTLGKRTRDTGRPRADAGFEIFARLFSDHEMTALSRALANGRVERSRAGARHLLRCPAVAALAHTPRLAEIAEAALGKAAWPFSATLFDKSPRANWLVVWHQDTALPLHERRDVPGWGPWSVKSGVLYAHAPAGALRRVVALRVHLDDSTNFNGPLRLIPGSDQRGLLSDGEIAELAKKVPSVDCLAPRGSVVLMRPLLVHSSSKAVPPAPRRVIHIEYTDTFEQEGGLRIRVVA